MKVVQEKAGSRLSLTMNSTVAPDLENPRSPTLLQATLETDGSFPTYPPEAITVASARSPVASLPASGSGERLGWELIPQRHGIRENQTAIEAE